MKRKQIFSAIIILLILLAANACIMSELSDPRILPVDEIILNRTNLVLNLWTDAGFDHRTAELKASILPEKANQAVLWGSGDSNIVTVENGRITAISKGTANIIVTAKDGGLMAICNVEVINQPPGPVQSIAINDMTLFIGGIAQRALVPVFSPFFVTDDRVEWETSNSAVVTVANGAVTATGPGKAVVTVSSVVDSNIKDTCTITVIPLRWQFQNIADFLAAGSLYYKPSFNFGTSPSGDSELNTTTWTGTNVHHQDFVIDYSYDYNLFGIAGENNLVPKFTPPDNQPSYNIQPGSYRSHTQYNNAALAHFAFTGFRQGHPWGITSIQDNVTGGITRAGQTWSPAINVYAANTNTVQYSGLSVDLGENTDFDLIMIYASSNINAGGSNRAEGAFNYDGDISARCLGLVLEYMPFSADAQTAFDRLYKPNIYETTVNWNNPAINNNWPSPGYPGSPWINGGKIIPNGSSWVYVFYFEQPVLARYLRISFEQAPVTAPATGFLGRAFVNSFEVYNTRAE